jgi:hypothetical protein
MAHAYYGDYTVFINSICNSETCLRVNELISQTLIKLSNLGPRLWVHEVQVAGYFHS